VEPQARQRLAGLMTDILMFYTVLLHLSSEQSVANNYKGTAEEAWEAFQLALEALPPDFMGIAVDDCIFIDGYERLRKAKMEQGWLANIAPELPVEISIETPQS
jgi:hypothetical protein